MKLNVYQALDDYKQRHGIAILREASYLNLVINNKPSPPIVPLTYSNRDNRWKVERGY